MSLLEMVSGLGGAGIRYIICGGVAGAAHGSRRVTDDLDILYDTSPDNTRALADLLAGWHAYPREVEPGLPFIMDERMLRAASVLTLSTDRGLLDVFREMKGVGTYERARRESAAIDLDGTTVRTLSLEQLIRAKRATGRPKDREHLLELETLRQLRRETR
jgi:predicted nucleotidyltransferase